MAAKVLEIISAKKTQNFTNCLLHNKTEILTLNYASNKLKVRTSIELNDLLKNLWQIHLPFHEIELCLTSKNNKLLSLASL